MSTAPAPTDFHHRRRHGWGFWAIAAAFAVGMAFSTVPTPLYPLYQDSDGFSTFTVTLVFAVYAVGVLTSLILAGHISDWVGRRRMILIALSLELVAAVMFALGTGLAVLVVARVVTGFGVGMLTATATAHLQELHENHRPHAGPTRFIVGSTTANIGGLGLGPLVAGAIAQWLPAPLLVPYLVFIVLLIVVLVATATSPETVRNVEPRKYRPQRVRPHGDPREYFAAALAGFAAFSVFGLYTSVAPSLVAQALGGSSTALSGVTAFAVFGAAATAQVLSANVSRGALRAAGIVSMAVGSGLMAIGVMTTMFWLFALSAVIAGAGAGMLFKSAVATSAASAPPERRGEAQAGLFVSSYVGLALPPVGVGVATLSVPLSSAIAWFAAGVIVIVLIDGLLSRQRRTA